MHSCSCAVTNCFQGDLLAETDSPKAGVLKVLRNLLSGTVEALAPDSGLQRLSPVLPRLLTSLQAALPFFDFPAVSETVHLLYSLLHDLNTRKTDLKDVSALTVLSPVLVSLTIQAEAGVMTLSKGAEQEELSRLSRESLSALQSLAEPGEAFRRAIEELVGTLERSSVESWHSLSEEVSAT